MTNEQSAHNEQGGEPLTIEDPPEELTNVNIGSTTDNNQTSNADVFDDDDDDDLTVIVLEQTPENNNEGFGLVWTEQDTPEMEERRRNVLLRELQRVQRASFVHFLILCLIPTSLLFIVIATVLGEDEECNSEATTCEKEDRTFINAFTTRCVCDAIKITTGEN